MDYERNAEKILIKGLGSRLLRQFAGMNCHISLKELILDVRDYESMEEDSLHSQFYKISIGDKLLLISLLIVKEYRPHSNFIIV